MLNKKDAARVVVGFCTNKKLMQNFVFAIDPKTNNNFAIFFIFASLLIKR